MPAVSDPAVKPPYRVPSMTEINTLPPNGFKVVSTFSGAGGSCLGYRMAGFRVVWANEFVPAAQASYRANAPDCALDSRDIRQVKPEEILERVGLKKGEADLFDGSPPCQAFSTAGKREKGWGKAKRYEHGASQCNETLFAEYIRILRSLMPKVFVAENVSGLVKGKAKGYFLEILRDLKASGYRVEARLLDAQWLGVPQMRQRIIFQGVRKDLGLSPAWPKPLPYRYSVRDALPEIGIISGRTGPHFVRTLSELDRPMNTIQVHDPAQTRYEVEPAAPVAAFRDRRGAFGKEGEITDQPAPSILSGTAGNLWLEDGFDKGIASIDGPARTVCAGRAVSIHGSTPAPTVLCHGRLGTRRPSGMLSEIVSDVIPIAPSRRQGPGFNMTEVQPDSPCPAVTCSSHGNDLPIPSPFGRCKFTIAELKRICAFPDDFVLIGSYSQQWERLGNSVPPVMMRHLAEVIRDRVLS